MCGIVGFVDNTPKNKKDKIIKDMADAIIHRGPDSDGYYTDSEIALGFRRLSIIDLEGGNQPIYNEKRDKVIIYNGELYNYQKLKKELIEKGHKFTTKTDTEVLLHGYEEYGNDLFPMLRGMYAFTIYDINEKKLVGCRDIFGIKPFYYYKDKNEFMFASEVKAMLKHPNFKKEINDSALKMYLVFQYSVFDETFLKNVYKLSPGHYFEYKNNELNIYKYYEFNYETSNKSYDDTKKELKKVLEDSINIHKITSDVEFGSYLSGGVDSSYVLSYSKPNKSFSVGFDEVSDNPNFTFDESVYAKELSKKLKIKNFSKLIDSDDFFEILPTIQYYTDEPHANLSTVPLYFLSQMASKEVKLVLSGEGADEMMGGYNEYNEPLSVRTYLHLPLSIRRFNASIAKRLPKFPGKNTILQLGKPLEERYIGHAFVMDEEEANEILVPRLRDNMMISDIIKPCLEKVKDKDDITKKMYIDLNFWLQKDILLKADKMSMANSLELRVPLLDKEVYEYTKTINPSYMIKDNQTKYIFRDIASERIPKEWSRRRKLGFPVPFSKWIRQEKYYEKVKETFNRNYVSNFFDKDFINKLLDEHYKGIKNNGRKIYNIYIFLIWYKVYFE